MPTDDNRNQSSSNQQQSGETKNYNLIRFGNRRDFVTSFVYDAYMAILNNSSSRLIPNNEKMIEDVRWVESIANALEQTGNQSWNIELKQQ